MKIFFTIVLASLIFLGCKTTAEQQPADEKTEIQMEDGITATVKYIDLEGGFYGIESDAGDSYLPINLADEFKEDGLRIVFKMRERTDIMTTRMWGKTVEIVEIERM